MKKVRVSLVMEMEVDEETLADLYLAQEEGDMQMFQEMTEIDYEGKIVIEEL